MLNLLDIKSNVFEIGSVFVDVYDQNAHLLFKTVIKPFKTEMEKANNIILFVDDKYNIIGGHIGLYTYNKGLHIVSFTIDN